MHYTWVHFIKEYTFEASRKYTLWGSSDTRVGARDLKSVKRKYCTHTLYQSCSSCAFPSSITIPIYFLDGMHQRWLMLSSLWDIHSHEIWCSVQKIRNKNSCFEWKGKFNPFSWELRHTFGWNIIHILNKTYAVKIHAEGSLRFQNRWIFEKVPKGVGGHFLSQK